ncbi:MAG: oxidoreductase molybdopterin binding protein [Fusobacteria bacterium]|nr:MAG: oxidoreductase molybdopterin binding protein [Fusobacteriota bacterium]KAF0230248.1 MAG: oxidoreductase molybdopterin binding [Fusobacteriota bacterium]
MKTKKKYLLLLSIVFSFIMLLSLSACNSSSNNDELRELAKVEIKEFEGKDLSSILEFRENSINGPQKVDIDTYRLKVDGLVNEPTDYTYDEVLTNTKYKKLVRLNCIEGWSVDILWEGILLREVFDKVEVKDTANTVIFYAADGYSTSLPLDIILEKDMMLAYKMNGVTLPPERGYPFQLIAEDKFGYKWIKWITRIELSDDEDYLGYWEKRGYDNEANLN